MWKERIPRIDSHENTAPPEAEFSEEAHRCPTEGLGSAAQNSKGV